MALWMTALKLVPWGDVIEAAPQVLQAAKKLMGKTQAAGTAPAAGTLTATDEGPTTPVTAQLQHLRERVAQLEQEQQDSAALIQSLAEQNAVVIRAVEALRLRNQRLGRALVGLAVVVAAVLVWVLRQP
ncbi:MAG: hypothetical protein KKB95_06280 [Gammaproteobacteria bacterium]|nr:hypothetical protein [Gammaproteobacteria bacterium]MBU2122031.1 hypothetical protein [Gammaproteobacteria bacterium]MBU2170046.1 hypothetical protein [Gammaproteobacteria bacterium]MBU2202606.1 hypothetical protein [Gammaproteobacteria bacterium]MBU2276346.1 hypothetical protein [Gammaproteobacteria bacterium]